MLEVLDASVSQARTEGLKVLIQDSMLHKNRAKLDGGAFYGLALRSLSIERTRFSGNLAGEWKLEKSNCRELLPPCSVGLWSALVPIV